MDWNLVGLVCGIIALWSSLIIATLKWIVDRTEQQIAQRLELLSKTIDGFRGEVHKLELELERFKREAAERFVGREDWIQFGIAIEAKIDRLGGKIDAVAR
jgi:hypothetical protein